MKFTAKILCFAIALMALTVSCRSKQQVSDSYSYYKFETTAISASPSGMLTVRAWGSGPDIANAIKEAQKNAVSDVIFKGVPGVGNYMGKPIVNEVNARERYADYFDRFFADGGEYQKFVKETSSKDGSRTEAKSKGRQNYGVTLDIDRNALRQQLLQDGVITQ